jgi:hypothetical protein
VRNGTRGIPERLAAHAGELRERREEARAAARASDGERATRARHDAQAPSEELRAIGVAISTWSARSEVARPSALTVTVFGGRPAEPEARAVWERAVGAVATYRGSHGIGTDEPTLLARGPPTADARAAWDVTTAIADDATRTLRRPGDALERLAVAERGRPRVR